MNIFKSTNEEKRIIKVPNIELKIIVLINLLLLL